LNEAFRKTSQNRGSFDNIKTNGREYIQMIENSKVLSELWEKYRSKNEYASEVEWSDALQYVKKVFKKIKI
jgi:hypothetical protein